MALGEDTQKMLAVKLPYLAPIAEELDEVLGIVKSQNEGKALIRFETQGIDLYGNLIIKCIHAGIRRFLSKKAGPLKHK